MAQSSSARTQTSTGTALETQRLDIWLFRTRILKTRTLAARIIRTGQVRVTHKGQCERILKPHKKIHAGDTITFMRRRQLVNIDVLSHPHRRGPAAEAQSHYQSNES